MAQRGSWANYVIWGCIAVCAVLGAALTIALVVGSHRGIQVAGTAKRTTPPAVERQQASTPVQVDKPAELAALAPPSALPAATRTDIARIDDALRSLATERDRLAQRIEEIERLVGDITASIKQQTVSPPPEPTSSAPSMTPQRVAVVQAAPPTLRNSNARPGAIRAPAPVSDPTEVFRAYTDAKPIVAPPTPTQAPMQIQPAEFQTATRTTENSTTKTEFGVDLGGEASMDGLRALWANLRGNHSQALANLRPVVAVRESGRAGVPELRLIAGPLANAGAAARTCAGLQAKGVACQTTVFDGQRLALR
jgi:hypothetical protein